MTVAGRDHVDPSQSARVRRAGPPGIDWTLAAPECPICWRRWLAGDRLTALVLSRRTHAALTTAALAVSATTPAAVLAAGPHQPHHRGASPKQLAPNDPALDPNLNPGGPGDATAPAPNEGDEPDDPATDPPPSAAAPPTADAPDPPAAEAAPPDAEPPPAPEDDPAPEAPVTGPDDGTAPPAAAPAPPSASATSPVAALSPERAPTRRHVIYATRSASSHRSRAVSAPTQATSRLPQAATRVVAPPARSVAPAAAGQARPGDRSHVVRAGESLWSIAGDHLGQGASTTRIAREVQRLWQLNRERIGTGDPNVVMAGTRLTLD
jgi:nucleoid-associated protein YgaU